jgi:capsular polysaccharide export protein
MARKFLFLQGVASPFFDQLADALIVAQQQVYKIHFCGGDHFYWTQKPAWDFADKITDLAAFIENKFLQFAFTDIILFGDMRPVHISAIALAKKYQAKIWVFEEGYLRPNWLTLEENGVNGNSLFPENPDYYQAQAKQIPTYQKGLDTGFSQYTRLLHDIQYNFFRYLLHTRFPHYQLHRPQSVLREYYGWLTRFPIQKTLGEYYAKKSYQQLLKNNTAFFLFPLQLHYDAQIIHHSPFNTIQEAITRVLESFALHAEKQDVLVFKNHPLDIGLINYRVFIRQLQKKLNLKDRVIYIDGGHLPSLLHHCKGTITINSTVGISALLHNSPVITLGKAIYNIQGLTFQGDLDEFWTQARPPDRKLFCSFRNTVIHYTQINGNFYTQQGIEMAVTHALARILASDPL